MPSVRRSLEHSLAAVITPEAAKLRQTELSAIENPVRRSGSKVLHTFATRAPSIAAHLLGIEYAPCKLPHIGTGYDNSVFRLDDVFVLKVCRESILLPDKQKHELLKQSQDQHNAMAGHLGNLAIEQLSFIGPHPFFPSRQALQTIQPYRQFVDPELKEQHAPDQHAAAIWRLSESYPKVSSQLRRFIERSYDLYAAHRLLPDTLGDSNLVIDTSTESVRMIDGQPLTEKNPRNHPRIFRHLDNLAYGLALAA